MKVVEKKDLTFYKRNGWSVVNLPKDHAIIEYGVKEKPVVSAEEPKKTTKKTTKKEVKDEA